MTYPSNIKLFWRLSIARVVLVRTLSPRSSSLEISFSNLPSFFFLVLGLNALLWMLCPDAWAVTDGDLSEEVAKGEKFITGGYMRLGLLAGCGIAGIISIFKQSVMGLIIAASGALFVFLMKGWISTSFTAII